MKPTSAIYHLNFELPFQYVKSFFCFRSDHVRQVSGKILYINEFFLYLTYILIPLTWPLPIPLLFIDD